jgi:hypothetical protein
LRDDTFRTGELARILALGAFAVVLQGCATARYARDMQGPPPSPSSPAGRAVAAAASRATVYPKFSDIPPVPTDVRSGAAWTRAVRGVKADQAQLQAHIAALPPPPSPADTSAFATEGAAEAKPPPSPDHGPSTQDFANAAQQEVAPPPKPK